MASVGPLEAWWSLGRTLWRRRHDVKLAIDVELRTMVQELLDRRWSPEQISQHLRRIYPNQPERHLVPETIYQAIYVQGRGELRRELHRALRTDRAVPGHWEGDLTMGAGRNSD